MQFEFVQARTVQDAVHVSESRMFATSRHCAPQQGTLLGSGQLTSSGDHQTKTCLVATSTYRGRIMTTHAMWHSLHVVRGVNLHDRGCRR